MDVVRQVVGCALAWFAGAAAADEGMDRCLLDQLAGAEGSATVAQIRQACASAGPVGTVPPAQNAPAVITERLHEEARTENSHYVITPHRQNYILLASYDQRRPDSAPYERDISEGGSSAQKVEAKMQISFKVPLVTDLFGGQGDIYGAYTQRSFWQVFNRRASAPFRETNYEPELWYQHQINAPILGWNLAAVAFGYNHQSNGRGKDFSRSWNRLFVSAVVEKGQFGAALRAWWRVKEDPHTDDNPNITHYMGNFDLQLIRRFGSHTVDMLVRNNLQLHGNRGALQLGWSFPLSGHLRAYTQLFSGYGESLIDYDKRQNAIGAGVMLTDW